VWWCGCGVVWRGVVWCGDAVRFLLTHTFVHCASVSWYVAFARKKAPVAFARKRRVEQYRMGGATGWSSSGLRACRNTAIFSYVVTACVVSTKPVPVRCCADRAAMTAVQNAPGESVEWVNMCFRKIWRVYQRGLERWITDLLQPVFDGLIPVRSGCDASGRQLLQSTSNKLNISVCFPVEICCVPHGSFAEAH